MKPFALFAAICTVALSAGAMKTANAATITETDNFTASGFTPSGSPVDPWTGSFTRTFDPTVSSSGALNAFSSNLLAGRYGTFTFVVVPQSGELTIRDSGDAGTDDYRHGSAGNDNAELPKPRAADSVRRGRLP